MDEKVRAYCSAKRTPLAALRTSAKPNRLLHSRVQQRQQDSIENQVIGWIFNVCEMDFSTEK